MRRAHHHPLGERARDRQDRGLAATQDGQRERGRSRCSAAFALPTFRIVKETPDASRRGSSDPQARKKRPFAFLSAFAVHRRGYGYPAPA
jgi:hypothetical protein